MLDLLDRIAALERERDELEKSVNWLTLERQELLKARDEDHAAILWLKGIADERMRLTVGRPLDLDDPGAAPFAPAIRRASEGKDAGQ